MALINCHNCSNSMSDKASVCPKCGVAPVKKEVFSCYECSTVLEFGAVTCIECGADLKLIRETRNKNIKSITSNVVSEPFLPTQKKKSSAKPILIIGGVVILAVLVFGVVSNKQKQTAQRQFAEELNNMVPSPPKIKYEVVKHQKRPLADFFKGCNLKGERKQLLQACDYKSQYLRNYAKSIAGKSQGEYNLGQICDIWENTHSNWKYVNDPRQTDFAEFASNTIKNGFNGDCDDFATALCAQILAIGGDARINYAYGKESAHAFTEVNLGKSDMNEVTNYISKRFKDFYGQGTGIWSREDAKGNKWVNLDWQAGYPGGKYFSFDHCSTFYLLDGYCEDY